MWENTWDYIVYDVIVVIAKMVVPGVKRKMCSLVLNKEERYRGITFPSDIITHRIHVEESHLQKRVRETR